MKITTIFKAFSKKINTLVAKGNYASLESARTITLRLLHFAQTRIKSNNSNGIIFVQDKICWFLTETIAEIDWLLDHITEEEAIGRPLTIKKIKEYTSNAVHRLDDIHSRARAYNYYYQRQ